MIANEPDYNISMHSTRDMSGHGTLICSIVARNYVKGESFFGYATGTASGVAPRARLAIYKVFGNSLGYESDLVAAIDQAITDGVDVISLSLVLLNQSLSLEEDILAKATFSAMEKVVASYALRGPSPYTPCILKPDIMAPGSLIMGAWPPNKPIGTI